MPSSAAKLLLAALVIGAPLSCPAADGQFLPQHGYHGDLTLIGGTPRANVRVKAMESPVSVGATELPKNFQPGNTDAQLVELQWKIVVAQARLEQLKAEHAQRVREIVQEAQAQLEKLKAENASGEKKKADDGVASPAPAPLTLPPSPRL